MICGRGLSDLYIIGQGEDMKPYDFARTESHSGAGNEGVAG